ncbi:carbon-nitrogen hydrolase family protein [Devriesea agamarum]|uniref:carbon-nitrogen hydrolase family protein n=1 Tax=Devriesea agamarum TaxID=472569 RepID=UPI00071DFBC9|nr:carbon-nitrogen hydrolase family protein [Devriesea agamarum]
MSDLNVALLQIASTDSLDGNVKKGIRACAEAKSMGADIALFPEMWSNGYDIYDRPAEEWQADAISADSDFVNTFGACAQQLGMAIGITYLEACATGPKNSITLFDRHGKRVLDYAKVHTCDFDVERALTAGDDFYVTDLDTEGGIVKIGAMICYDREFPESARVLMLKGAEIVLVPNACPMEINRLSQLRARAYENMMGLATCNYPDNEPDCNGHSNAFDGVAYRPQSARYDDMCILEAPGDEGIYMAEFDLDLIREYRQCEVHGNAFRRPGKYQLLIGSDVDEPFIRSTRRK